MLVKRTGVAAALVSAVASAEFCPDQLWGSQHACENNQPVEANGCCQTTNECPSTCLSRGWNDNTVNGQRERICKCDQCQKVKKTKFNNLNDEDRWLNAHNYFRCLHNITALEWNYQLVTQSRAAAQVDAEICTMKHSKSYSAELRSEIKSVRTYNVKPRDAVINDFRSLSTSKFTIKF